MTATETGAAPAQDRTRRERGAMMRRATYAAVCVAFLLIVMKAVAFFLTDSVAMLGTLFDSLLDGAASTVNLLAVRHALTPADQEHRFGHGKAEALAGLGQAFLIFGSAGYIAFEAASRFVDPHTVENSAVGIAVTVLAIAITLVLVAYQRHVVKRTNSVAIAADSIHYRGDLLMNLSVILALVLSGMFGIHWADPIFGIGIAAMIAYSAAQIVHRSYDQLMDRELSDEDRDRIKTIARGHAEVMDIHDLRTRMAGTQLFVQFHLELDPNMSLMKAHEIADDVEARIVEEFPGAEVLIHQDPAGLEELTRLERV